MSINRLTYDIIDNITQHLDGDDVIRLWLTGDSSWHTKLCQCGGIQQLRISLEHWKSIRWPSVVREFCHLTSFTFHDMVSSVEHHVRDVDLLTLPRTLKVLDISLSNDWDLFQDAISRSPTHFSDLEVIRMSVYEGRPVFDEKFRQSVPNLREISFPTPSAVSDLDVAMLPPYLTIFDCPVRSLVIGPTSRFPPTLTKLKMLIRTLDQDWVPLLPDALVYCVVLPSTAIPSTDYWQWHKLPRNLTLLETVVSNLTETLLRALPSSMLVLSLRSFTIITSELLSMLPSSITELRGMLPPEIGMDLALALPKSLTILAETVQPHTIPKLPPNITSIRIAGMTDVDDIAGETISLPLRSVRAPRIPRRLSRILPQTVTSLRIADGTASLQSLKALPRHLTELSILRTPPLEIDEGLQYLPHSLFSLNLQSIVIQPGDEFVLSPDSSKWIPRQVTELSLGPVRIPDDQWFSFLPRTITDLKLMIIKSHSIIWNINLPERLRTFQCGIDPLPENAVPNIIRALPITLTTLIITTRDLEADTMVTDEELINLPRGLRSLRIPTSTHLTPSIQDLLPPKLYTLNIQIKRIPKPEFLLR